MAMTTGLERAAIDALKAELERTDATITRLGAQLASHPQSRSLDKALSRERAHRDQVATVLERHGQGGRT
jgi:hypothetical protein